jgi:hypothetical protein
MQIVICDHRMLTGLHNIRDETYKLTIAELVDPQIEQRKEDVCPVHKFWCNHRAHFETGAVDRIPSKWSVNTSGCFIDSPYGLLPVRHKVDSE